MTGSLAFWKRLDTVPHKLWPNQCTCILENHDDQEPLHGQQKPAQWKIKEYLSIPLSVLNAFLKIVAWRIWYQIKKNPLLIFHNLLINCLVDNALILYREITYWSLPAVKGLKNKNSSKWGDQHVLWFSLRGRSIIILEKFPPTLFWCIAFTYLIATKMMQFSILTWRNKM